MFNRIDRRAAQHVKPIRARLKRAPHVFIKVTDHQQIRMQVVAAKHAECRMGFEQRCQRREIARRRALANENLHPRLQLVHRLRQSETLVIRRDARRRIIRRHFAPQAGRVSIDRLAEFFRGGNHRHQRRIPREHAGKIHHLAEVFDFFASQQPRHRAGIKCGAGRFESRRRNAGRRAKIELERRARTVANHVVHASDTQDVGDFMRIGDRRHGAMNHGPPRKLRRRQHRTLDMDMRIDQTGCDEVAVTFPRLRHEPDDASAPPL